MARREDRPSGIRCVCGASGVHRLIRIADEDGPIPYGDYVPRLSPKHLRIRRVGNTSAVQAHIPDTEIPRLRLEDVIEVTVGREWKVDGFGPVPKTSPPKT